MSDPYGYDEPFDMPEPPMRRLRVTSDTTDRDLLLALVEEQDLVARSYKAVCRQFRLNPCTGKHIGPGPEGEPRKVYCRKAHIDWDEWCYGCKRTWPAVLAWHVNKQRLGRARAAVTRRGHQIMKEAKGE